MTQEPQARRDPSRTGSSREAFGPLIRDAWDAIDPVESAELVRQLVDIPSPTGEERTLATFAAAWMTDRGLRGGVQRIDEKQANAFGSVGPGGAGRNLLLYAPIDTVTVGDASEDVPGVGDSLRDDLRCEAVTLGRTIRGLGASNPKGHAAAAMLAAAAVARTGVPLAGSLYVGLGAGGMPTNHRMGQDRGNVGQGSGCSFMIEQGMHPDAAIIAKPGWVVAWEEVGLCWFRVAVRGTYNYVGSRHRLPYRNANIDAARAMLELDRWFDVYSAGHTSGLVAPQGHIGAIEGGWQRMPAFSPARCDFLVDLRISPRTSPAAARREFLSAIADIRDSLGIDIEAQMMLGIPGTSTDRDHWIVRATTEAWERVTGQAHVISDAQRTASGATDANILRARGIPTARVGMARIEEDGNEVDFALGMNAVDLDQLHDFTRVLVAAAIDVTVFPGHQ